MAGALIASGFVVHFKKSMVNHNDSAMEYFMAELHWL